MSTPKSTGSIDLVGALSEARAEIERLRAREAQLVRLHEAVEGPTQCALRETGEQVTELWHTNAELLAAVQKLETEKADMDRRHGKMFDDLHDKMRAAEHRAGDAEATVQKLAEALREWDRDHAPPGDAIMTPAEQALDRIGEILGLWGNNSAAGLEGA